MPSRRFHALAAAALAAIVAMTVAGEGHAQMGGGLSNPIGDLPGDSTAASPALELGAGTGTGLYRINSTGVSGISNNGLRVLEFDLFNGGGGTSTSTTRIRMAKDQTVSNPGVVAYLTSFVNASSLTINDDTPWALVNFNLSSVTVNSGTKSYRSWNTEMDKMVVSVSSGSATFSNGLGSVLVRVPIVTTNVTTANLWGIGFTPPNASDVTGTATTAANINFPPVVAPAVQPTNGWHGILAETGYTSHLGTIDGVPLLVTANAIGSTAGDLRLNAKNSGGTISLQTNTQTVVSVGAGDGTNKWTMTASTNPTLLAGGGTNANAYYIASGTGWHSFFTNGGTAREQVRIIDGNNNDYLKLTGGASTPPTVTVDGSSTNQGLNLSSKGTGSVFLQYGGTTIIQATTTTGNYFQFSANSSPLMLMTGAGTNVSGGIASKGTGNIDFYSHSTSSPLVRMESLASSVNYVRLTGGTTGNPVIVGSLGSDTDVGITLTPKGAGLVRSTAGLLSSSATAAIGYSTGAGGSVSQATSKSTGVTLSKTTGQVTMDSGALAAGTTVSFTLTNTVVAAGDMVLCQHVSGGTVGAYTVTCQAGAGTATVAVRNVTGGSLSEAIVVQFVVIKAVTAELKWPANDNVRNERAVA